MIYIRSVAFLLSGILVTVFYGLFTVPLSIIYHDWGYECARSWGRQILRLAKYVCGIDYEIRGLDNIPEQACVVMAKHQSAWETVAILASVPKSVWMINRNRLQAAQYPADDGHQQQLALDNPHRLRHRGQYRHRFPC